ncbi:MAG: glycosyltransferase [Anaerolineae bacterium]|nr:glycosyltransferase [Anaerolineae bacterium]
MQLVNSPAVIQGNGYRSKFGFLWALPKARALVKTHGIKIVHCHLRASWVTGVLLAMMMGRRRPKVVFHEHGWILFGGYFYRAFVRIAAKFGLIVGVSNLVVNRLALSKIPMTRLKMVHNFVDMAYFTQDSKARDSMRKSLEDSEEKFLIGFSGRLVAVKGWRYLLEAMELLSKRKGYKALFAGTGPDEEKLKAAIQKSNLTGLATPLGHVKNINHFYNALDVLVIPSVIEPVGMVQLEAQACGTPVVAFDTEGVREIIGNSNARLIPVGDVKALASAIEELRKDGDQYDKLVNAGLDNAKRFSLENYASKINALYEELLRE